MNLILINNQINNLLIRISNIICNKINILLDVFRKMPLKFKKYQIPETFITLKQGKITCSL